MSKSTEILISIVVCAFLMASPISNGQSSPTPALPEKVILDTDIGDDIDDAFAVALALRSPELQILGITTTFGDTETRAKLLDRFLAEAGHPEIPVAAGAPSPPKSNFTQRRYAESGRFAKPAHPDAATFRKLKRVILMGGSIKRGYGDLDFGPPHPPEPEWNILNDIPSAQKLFAAGVPLFVMPLNATQLKLDEVKRALLFNQDTP